MSDPQWFSELRKGGFGLTIRKDKVLVDKQTKYQHMEIFENEGLGRVFILDGCVMLTEQDEYSYHEMLVHPALLAHPNPEKVLIIGGGDGGTLRETLKHPEVQEAILCEIDQDVIDASREFLPFTAVGLDHPKAKIFVGDGIQFLKDHEDSFDVIIVDSTDPVGFAEGLFGESFYRDVKASLREDGIFVQQTESPLFDKNVYHNIYKELGKVFKKHWSYGAVIPMYPSGYWTFGMASNDIDPWLHYEQERADSLEDLNYYTSQLQYSAFDMPNFAKMLLQDIK